MAGPEKLLQGAGGRRNSGRRDSGQASAVSGQPSNAPDHRLSRLTKYHHDCKKLFNPKQKPQNVQKSKPLKALVAVVIKLRLQTLNQF